jgi:hypothetical protein
VTVLLQKGWVPVSLAGDGGSGGDRVVVVVVTTNVGQLAGKHAGTSVGRQVSRKEGGCVGD